MTVTELCTLVTRAEFRPFDKSDYDGWMGISAEGPHEIAEVDQYTIVRDGDMFTAEGADLSRWQVRMELV